MSLLYITWNVNPEIFHTDMLSMGYYNLLFVGGLILSSWVIKKIFSDNGIPEAIYYKLLTYSALGIIIGARLGHCLFYDPAYYLHHPLEMILPFSFEGGNFTFTGYRGLASHGGTIGLIIALILYSRKTKQNLIKTLDYIATATPLAACCIRLGNLMNSEIIGKVTDVPWAFIFTRVDAFPRHPAQLYEAIAYLIFFAITVGVYTKCKKIKPGFIFGLTLTLIFTFRFFVEFLKEREIEFEKALNLDMGQVLSIPFILIGVYFLFFYKSKKKG